MSIADKIKKYVKEAPVAQGGTNINFGALTAEPVVVTFHGKGVKPTKLTLAEYAEERDTDPAEVELEENDQLQIHFSIAVQELNPNLTFPSVDRDIAIIASGPKVKTDWSEIVEPSLVKVFGANWEEALFGKGNKPAKPVYVAAEMVDSLRPAKQNPDGTPGKVYTMPRFIAKYATREECEEARDERYGKPADVEGADIDVEDEDDDTPEFPANVLKQVWGLYKSGKKNDRNVLGLIAKNKQWNAYDADELLAAAKEAGEGGEFDD